MSLPQPLPKQRILFVDDESSVRDAVRMVLTYEGHSVEAFEGGPQALKRFAPDAFDLVITDFLMPEMSGAEFALAIKERAPQTPIIMLTAFPPETVPKGIDLVLTKPFMIDALREGMRKVLPLE